MGAVEGDEVRTDLGRREGIDVGERIDVTPEYSRFEGPLRAPPRKLT